MTVTAHLQAGIVHAHAFGIALDGLLASVLHGLAQEALLDAGGAPQRTLDLPDAEDLDLPLARCGAGDPDWHWAATFAWPHPVHTNETNAAVHKNGAVVEPQDGPGLEVRQ